VFLLAGFETMIPAKEKQQVYGVPVFRVPEYRNCHVMSRPTHACYAIKCACSGSR
jgi:hypothetical protein